MNTKIAMQFCVRTRIEDVLYMHCTRLFQAVILDLMIIHLKSKGEGGEPGYMHGIDKMGWYTDYRK